MNAFRSLLVLFVALSTAPASPLQKGEEAFRSGEFAEAAKQFEAANVQGQVSAGLFYNMGLAWKRDGNPAKASLNLRRALMLNPTLVDARMELSDLERSQGIPLEPVDWRGTLAEKIPLLPLLWTGFWVFWAGAFWLLYLVLRRNGRFFPVTFGIFACLLGATLFLATYSSDPRFLWRSAAVAMESSSLLAAPADRSETLARVPLGSMVHVLRTSGQWAYCSLPDGTSGWTQAAPLTPLVPSSGKTNP